MAFSRQRPAALGPLQRPSWRPGMTTGIGTEQAASSPRRRTRQARSLEVGLGPQRRERAPGLGRGERRRSRANWWGDPSPQAAVVSPAAEPEITARRHRASGQRAARTLRTQRMNDDSAAHSPRARVTAGGFVRARWGPCAERWAPRPSQRGGRCPPARACV
ncbi:hypothetical protein STEG23_025578 [Scotinomys teguina]